MEALLTNEDVARVLGVHPETVRQWAREGRLPAVKFKHNVRFRREDIDQYIRAHLKYEDVARAIEGAGGGAGG